MDRSSSTLWSALWHGRSGEFAAGQSLFHQVEVLENAAQLIGRGGDTGGMPLDGRCRRGGEVARRRGDQPLVAVRRELHKGGQRSAFGRQPQPERSVGVRPGELRAVALRAAR